MTTPNCTPQVSAVVQIEALYDRLSKARTLVANGKVHRIYGMVNYYVVEGSNARYLVNGSCNCADATNRVELTKGLCKHRLATMVYAEQVAKAETPKASKVESPPDEELRQKGRRPLPVGPRHRGGLETHPIHPPLQQLEGDSAMSNKVYEIVTEKIIAALESGPAPWHKPWKAGIARDTTTRRW